MPCSKCLKFLGSFLRCAGTNLEISSHRQLETIQSLEALEMIKDHLYSVIESTKGISLKLEKGTMGIQMSLLGQLYASCIVYGYFIRQVAQKFQLEKRMQDFALPTYERHEKDYADLTCTSIANSEGIPSSKTSISSKSNRPKGLRGILMDEQSLLKPCKLRDYVSSFDPEILDRCARLRFQESLDVLEKQTQALFGRPDSLTEPDFHSGGKIHISCSQMRLLVLEAVAFGSFLWDVECHVESHFTLHPIPEEK